MKFIVSSSSLLKQLQIIGGIINNNNTLPIKNILKDSIEQFEKDTTKMSGKILDPSEVDVLL